MLYWASVLGAAHALCDSIVNVVRHVGPMLLFFERFVQTSLFGVFRCRRFVCEV